MFSALLKEKNQTDRTGKNIKIVLVNPGTMRSTSRRNVISNGSVTMLILVYCILLYPILYLFTKSGSRGGQRSTARSMLTGIRRGEHGGGRHC